MTNHPSSDSRSDNASSGPLTDIRVLDLSSYIAGPYGATLLADMGADVVKIEAPTGDNLRNYPSTLDGASRAFLGVNRGKRGLALDLKKADGQAVLHRLAGEADVLVHNFRPGVPERIGADYERLRTINPRLVYCAATGYGERGPLKDKAGYDQVLQTMTGICSFQGQPNSPPQIVYGSVVDYYAASMIASGVAAALFERERTGHGQYVGVSLLRSALAMQSTRMIWGENESREVNRDMRSGGITGLYPTADGYIYISANTPHFWQALCTKTGLHQLSEDTRYDTVRKRAQHADTLTGLLREALAARSALEWEALFGNEVPCAAARTIEDMFDHPQVQAEELVQDYNQPDIGRFRGFAGPIDFEHRPPIRRAPGHGEHTDAVLSEYGYSWAEIEQLRAVGAVVTQRGNRP